MANTWTVYIQVNGIEMADYMIEEMEVSQEEYDAMQDAVANNIPLRELDFYKSLVSRAADLVDFDAYLDEDEEPYEENYYVPREELEEIPEELKDNIEYRKELVFDEESYQDDYDTWKGHAYAYFGIAAIDIYDPGDMERFKKKYIGRELEKDTELEFEEIGERVVRYKVHIMTDNGFISDIEIIADGVESDGLKWSSSSEAYPGYDFLVEEIDKRLENPGVIVF